MTELVALVAADTHPLRRAILRDGTPSDDVEFEGDDDPSTMHLGARVDGELVAVSTWMARRHPDLPGRPGFQLRGMATVPQHRGTGISAELLRFGLERCRDAGAEVVWARARTTALGFYLRHGFVARGHEYTDLTTWLPHRDIVLVL